MDTIEAAAKKRGRKPGQERLDAIASGRTTYTTGKPCSKGHVSPRWTASRHCVECTRTDAAMVSRRRNCASSHKKLRPDIARRQSADRHAAKMMRIPRWHGELDQFVMQEAADLARLREAATGLAWHVDHMVPLQAREACGLHCADNLQVIPAVINVSKGRRMMYTAAHEWVAAL